MPSTTDNALRRVLANELRKHAGWDSDLHTYSFDLTIEQSDFLVALLTTPHPQGADDWRPGVEAAARVARLFVDEFTDRRDDQLRDTHPTAALVHARQAQTASDIEAAIRDLQPPASVESDQDERVRKHAEKIATLRPPVSVEATGAGREKCTHEDYYPDILTGMGLCQNCGAKWYLSKADYQALAAPPDQPDQPGSPEREKVALAIANSITARYGLAPVVFLDQLSPDEQANMLRYADAALASLRTTPAPCVDSGNVQGWRTPRSLHWLGDFVGAGTDRFAKDRCGCVMYFATEAECNLFMEWMTACSVEEDRLTDPGYRSGGDAEGEAS